MFHSGLKPKGRYVVKVKYVFVRILLCVHVFMFSFKGVMEIIQKLYLFGSPTISIHAFTANTDHVVLRQHLVSRIAEGPKQLNRNCTIIAQHKLCPRDKTRA